MVLLYFDDACNIEVSNVKQSNSLTSQSKCTTSNGKSDVSIVMGVALISKYTCVHTYKTTADLGKHNTQQQDYCL